MPPRLQLRTVDTQPTSWDPGSARVTLNVRLDAAIVPSVSGGARVAYSHIAVLDDFIPEEHRRQLLAAVTSPTWEEEGKEVGGDRPGAIADKAPPQDKWERRTADGAGLPATWGLRPEAMRSLVEARLPAMVEVQSRLVALYPEYDVCHMPSNAIQGGGGAQRPDGPGGSPGGGGGSGGQGPSSKESKGEEGSAGKQQQGVGQQQQQQDASGIAVEGQEEEEQQQQQDDAALMATGGSGTDDTHGPRADNTHASRDEATDNRKQADDDAIAAAVECGQYVANAAVYGDCFRWHVDADPSSFPPGAFRSAFGDYFQGEPGRPLFVTALAYLDGPWPLDHDAETLFLDGPTDCGLLVRPKPGRLVLMDQDVLHRLSTPSMTARRPRFSLVWKLLLVPRAPGQAACIARHEWGPPTDFGSAARLAALRRTVERKRAREEQEEEERQEERGGRQQQQQQQL